MSAAVVGAVILIFIIEVSRLASKEIKDAKDEILAELRKDKEL